MLTGVKKYWIIISVLVAIIILQWQCRTCPKTPEPEIIEHTTIIPGDTIFRKIPTPYPVPKLILRIDTFKQPLTDLDTLQAIEDYYCIKKYNDTISDSTMRVVIDETLFKNSILKREVFMQNLREKQIQNYVIGDKKKLMLFVGFSLGGRADNFGAGGQLVLVTKKRQMYSYNYDILNNSHTFGVLWKIGKKER